MPVVFNFTASTPHAAGFSHGMKGISAQIHDDLVNLGRVGQDSLALGINTFSGFRSRNPPP